MELTTLAALWTSIALPVFGLFLRIERRLTKIETQLHSFCKKEV